MDLSRDQRVGAAWVCLAMVLAAAAPDSAAGADQPGVSVELNKLEQVEGACRSFLVVDNATSVALESLTLDLVVFDVEGVIAQRLAVDLAPVEAGGLSVKAFDMSGIDCADVGRMLMNGVLSCAGGNGADAPCAGPPAISARGDVPFID